MMLLLDRWYRGLIVSSELALGLFPVLGPHVVGLRSRTGLHVSYLCCCPAECGML